MEKNNKEEVSSDEAKASKPQVQQKIEKAPAFDLPTVQDMFKVGAHFGHETRRWNPKMKKYIYDSKKGIHIIDVTQSVEKLKEAAEFIYSAAKSGSIIFVGTKRQASPIVKELAVDCGAHFVNQRWAGGLLTNFKEIQKSFRKLSGLEKMFEEGVEGRTKYEISLMKKDWQKLNRLYGGVKSLSDKPKAIVVVDSHYEKGVVREAKHMGIPVVAIVDTNSDPDLIDYIVPANDDAISSIELILGAIASVIKKSNSNFAVKHMLKDYSKAEVKITKREEIEESSDLVEALTENKTVKVARMPSSPVKKSTSSGGGILEQVQKQKELSSKTNSAK